MKAWEETPANEAIFEAMGRALKRLERKKDPEGTLQNIRDHFPSPAFFLESSVYSMKRIGIPRLEAFYFHMIPGMARTMGREVYGPKPMLNKLSRMATYLHGLYTGIHVECFYLVLLNSHGRLIDTVLVQRGTTDSAPFYLGEVLAIAVRREARALVLCHNHPGGTLRPSNEDLICTLQMLKAVTSMGLPLLDHIIVTEDQAVSIRDCGLLPPDIWMMQGNTKLLREWVDVDLLSMDTL